ncbi:extracellular solute-binding protein [Eisenbergiella tayi]|uniref:extracellular solute-binding protein n=1 Tax=Eisenbergiella tayi TaxID=1432052 RepID=UPI0028A481A6|nr:extracellular solute-binding protein [Eisenbergiella tayi]MDT4532784.1 extracellular solute-binding protein [Eisenbergiella tayi]
MKAKARKSMTGAAAVITALAVLAGCGAPKTDSGQTNTYVAPEETNGVVNGTNLEGLPIAAEPITLTVGVSASSSSFQGAWEDLDWIKQLQEVSGITLEFRVYNSDEDKNLMFTSRDYPDISFNVGTDKQIQNAALGGDIYQLDELIQTYAPNWSSFLSENDYARKVVTLSDGHIYSLPIVRDEPSNGGLRDQWLIQTTWLNELNLDIPQTTDEFYETLKAFKEHAGEGSIPKDVIPYYIYGITNNVGGALDVINSFGVEVAGERYLSTVDNNGKVVFNFANEDIKEPLLYLRKLFQEGLIPGECLTDDWDTYITKTRSTPAVVGSYHSYQNPDVTNESITAMGPLDSGNGKSPLIRSQTNHVLRNHFTIYKNCKYPEAAMRLANLIADPDWSIQAMYGMYGDTYLQKNEDGSIVMLPYEADAQGADSAPMNRVPFLLTSDMFEKFSYAEGSAQKQRDDAIKNQYDGYIIPTSNLYPNVIFSTEQTDRLAELSTDINDYINTTLSTWMLEGGIEEGWDAYIEQLNKLGLEEYISILQEALDTFNAN